MNSRVRFIGSWIRFVLLVGLLAGCSSSTPAPAAEGAAGEELVIATADTAPAPSATNTSQPDAEAAPALRPTPLVSEAPPEPTSDRERALATFTAAPQAAGEVMIVYGKVLDGNGNPMAGTAVEIWQTDASGVYDHPNDPGTASRDLSFQFYGTSVTDESGLYLFRTVRPAEYGSRPPHLHVKVKAENRELLTTQFYFTEDKAGVQSELLLLTSESTTDAAGRSVLLAQKDIVIGSGGSLEPTPAQTEGPYYPVVQVANYDNDLTITN